MGQRGKRGGAVPWTAESIQERLNRFLDNPRYALRNLYVFGWESDLLFLTRHGYWYEMEVKISRADFKADFANKTGKHRTLASPHEERKPNFFYYAVPENLIAEEEIPPYAGLVYLTGNGFWKIVRKAPKLHAVKHSPEDLLLADKFYRNMQQALHVRDRAKKQMEQIQEPFMDGMREAVEPVRKACLMAFSNRCPHRTLTTVPTRTGEWYCPVRKRHVNDKVCSEALCDWLGGVYDLADDYLKTLLNLHKMKI